MATWEEYKEESKAYHPTIKQDIEEIEAMSHIVGSMIEKRHDLNLSQRDLAKMCGIPHSSVARIESGKSSPNLSTLLKIFSKLGLSISVEGMSSASVAKRQVY